MKIRECVQHIRVAHRFSDQRDAHRWTLVRSVWDQIENLMTEFCQAFGDQVVNQIAGTGGKPLRLHAAAHPG